MNDNDTPSSADNANVIPPTEMDRRRRVLACVEDMADLCKDVFDRASELHVLGVPAADWMNLVAAHGPVSVQQLVGQYGGFFTGFVDGFFDARAAGATTSGEGVMAALAGMATRSVKGPDQVRPERADAKAGDVSGEEFFSWETMRMKKVLERLFAEAPKMTDGSGKSDATQAPALECHVVLKGGAALHGALSVTPEGTLRLLAPNQVGQKPVMVEHFFDYEQVADVAVFREVKASEGSRIITS